MDKFWAYIYMYVYGVDGFNFSLPYICIKFWVWERLIREDKKENVSFLVLEMEGLWTGGYIYI